MLPLSSPRLVTSLRAYRQPPRRHLVSTKASQSSNQAIPLGRYYEHILNKPVHHPKEQPDNPSASPTITEISPPIPASTPTQSNPSNTPKPGRGRKSKEEKPSPGNGKSKLPAAVPPPPSTAAPPAPVTPPPSTAAAKAQVIFGSRLLGPAEQAERLAAMRDRSSLVAGVLVPPRPEEPDNCCMSGCVNCVWDRYRDDMEHWASSTAEAQRRLTVQENGASGTTIIPPLPGAAHARGSDFNQGVASMDDDGGGSATTLDTLPPNTKITKDLWDDELYKNLPVGIREFMKQEKRLKLKHEREGTVGG